MLHFLQKRKPVVTVTAAAALLGAIVYKIGNSSGKIGLSVVLTVLFALCSGAVAFVQKPRPKYLANHRSGPLSMLGMLAPVILLICAIVELVGKSYAAFACALIDALVLGSFVLFAVKRDVPSPAFPAVLTVANIVRLIAGYRKWCIVPQVSKYVYLLLAGMAVMFFSYYLLLFALDKGSRRVSVFLSMFGTYLCMSAALYGGVSNCLFFFSWAIYLISELSALMTPGKKRRVPKRPSAEQPALEEPLQPSAEPTQEIIPAAAVEEAPADSVDTAPTIRVDTEELIRLYENRGKNNQE